MSDIMCRRRTADGVRLEIDTEGVVWRSGLQTFTRHRGLRHDVALELAEAVSLFDAAEIPSLIEAAADLSKGGRAVEFWSLVARAVVLSTRAGTIPGDMPAAMRWVTLAAAETPETLRQRDSGYVPCPKPGRRVLVPIAARRPS